MVERKFSSLVGDFTLCEVWQQRPVEGTTRTNPPSGDDGYIDFCSVSVYFSVLNTRASLTVILSLLSLGVALALVVSKRPSLRDTTLIAPYRWTCVCLWALAAVRVFEANADFTDSTQDALRYAAATATFCPLMAILGAKRPQNIGWQFIVFTLWIILILPVGEMLVLWRGGELDEGPARQWFFVILLLLGFSNYALTRFLLPALLATAGQALLLLPHLPFAFPAWQRHFDLGIGLIGLAVVVAWLRAKPHTSGPHQEHHWDAVWTDFRDAFGLVWALRVMERVNSTAKLAGWQSSLTWYGFHPANLDDASERQQVDRTLRTLLRRFVSDSWIARRGHGGREFFAPKL